MDRQQKTAAIDRLQRTFAAAPHLVLASFAGLTVNQESDLRRRLRQAGGGYVVIKNRLAKRAAAGTPLEPLQARLTGPCAVATHPSDPVELAKVLTGFAKDNPQLVVMAAVVDAQQALDAAGVKQLAALPGLLELRAQLLALIQTPGTMLVRLVATPGTMLARVVDARRKIQAQDSPEG